MSQLFYTIIIISFVALIHDVGCQQKFYLQRQKPVMQKALTYLNECRRQVPLERNGTIGEKNCLNLFTYFKDLFHKMAPSFNFTREVEECGQVLPAPAGRYTTNRKKRMPVKHVKANPYEYNALIKDYPSTVFISVKANITARTRNKKNYQLHTKAHSCWVDCTGSIIHQSFIVTAAHCIEFARKSYFESVLWKTSRLGIKGEEVLDIVSVEVSEIEVHMGEVFMEPYRPTRHFIPQPTRTVRIQKHEIKYEIHPGYLDNDEKRWLLDERFTKDVRKNYFLPHKMHNDAVAAEVLEHWPSPHDIGLIYIPRRLKINYTDIIKPVCLPAYHPRHYTSCALQYEEEFVMAGYGMTRNEAGPGLFDLYARGLNSLKSEIIALNRYEGKCGEIFETNAIKGQHMMRGGAPMDSGAAGVLMRNLRPTRVPAAQSDERFTQMALYVASSSNSKTDGFEYYVDVLSHIRWLAQAMIHLWNSDILNIKK